MLDFKLELLKVDDKCEFYKDLCVFVNVEGGDFVYGIV